MKIEVDNNRQIILKEVFDGILLESADKEIFGICMRDSGYEFSYQGKMYEAKEGTVREFGYLDKPADKPIIIRVAVTLKPCHGGAFGDIGITYPETISFFYDPHKTTVPQELVNCKVLGWENIYENEPHNVTSMRVTVECEVLDKDKFIHNLYCAVMFLREPREVALFVSKCEIIDSNEISPTTKESYDGGSVNPQAMDEVGTMEKLNLLSHSEKIEILNSYSIWLTKNGYMDTDWKDEEPFAIDSFLSKKD